MSNQNPISKSQTDRVSIIQAVTSPLGFYTLIVLMIEGILAFMVKSIQGPERNLLAWCMVGLLALLIIVVALLATFRPDALLGKHYKKATLEAGTASENMKQSPVHIFNEKLGAGMIFENSDSAEFSALFGRLFLGAKRIIMVGTGFNILRRDHIRDKLIPRIQSGCEMEIYAANPFSPNVEARLIEEETGSPKPIIGRYGLEKWLDDFLTLKKKPGNLKLSLRLFPFYPTYALFIFDEREYLFYPYGYTQLGTLSPVLHYSRENPAHTVMVNFFQGQYERVKECSSDAELIFKLRTGKKVDPNQLTAFAVYLVPEANSELYKFGSEILEYDVRAGKELQSTKWHQAIGAAANFGFHLTVADALYCTNPKDLDLISEEVKYVAREFRPFTLSFRIEKDFPNEQGIALVCQDESGVLEALRHEMVARVYRKAMASNYSYSLGIAQPNRDPNLQRAKLMIEHYHAPYILQSFKPHFSLLSNVPVEKKDQIYQDLKKAFERRVTDFSIDFRGIAVMEQPDPAGRWQIRNEYNLGGV